MMSKVIQLPVVTTHDLDPDTLLENSKGKLKHFVLVGYDLNGNEFFSSTKSNGPEALWMLERAKHKLLKVVDELS